jgi:hypothetical protein
MSLFLSAHATDFLSLYCTGKKNTSEILKSFSLLHGSRL